MPFNCAVNDEIPDYARRCLRHQHLLHRVCRHRFVGRLITKSIAFMNEIKSIHEIIRTKAHGVFKPYGVRK